MTTHTIEVIDIDDDLLRYVDGRVRANEAPDRAAYIHGLPQRDFEQRLAALHAADKAGKPGSERTFSEIAAPIAEDIELRGYTDEDINQILDAALLNVRRERRARKAETVHQEAA